MTNQQDDDLAAFVVSETELAALVPTRDDLERWLAECAHRARLMELADERGMVGDAARSSCGMFHRFRAGKV